MCMNKMNRALSKKGRKMARKYTTIVYLLKLMLTAPHSPDFVFSSKIISSCGIQRASCLIHIFTDPIDSFITESVSLEE